MHISDYQFQLISAQINAHKRQQEFRTELPKSAERKRGFTAISTLLLRLIR